MSPEKLDSHPTQPTVSAPAIDMLSLFQQVEKVSRNPSSVQEATKAHVFEITHTSSGKKVQRDLPKLKLQPPVRQEITPKRNPDYFSHLAEDILGYRDQIMARVSELRDAGIIYEEGIWYFESLKVQGPWSRIDGGFFQDFPEPSFNISHKVGNARGRIKTPLDLAKLFRVLGFHVATFSEQKTRWACMIKSAERPLRDAGIIYEDGEWYFGDARGREYWPKIQEKSFAQFPSCAYNKDYSIGTATGEIRSIEDLKKLFHSLGLVVATETREKNRWASVLKESKQAFESMGVVEERGIWYFGDTKGNNNWIKVQGKPLSYFPNGTFIKKYSLNDNGQMTHPTEIAKLFRVLGLRVATLEEEKTRWARMIIEHEDDFKKARIFREGGVWDFSRARGHTTWPIIHGRCLVNFPNAQFKQTRQIGSTGGNVTNAIELSRLFVALGLQVIPPHDKSAGR